MAVAAFPIPPAGRRRSPGTPAPFDDANTARAQQVAARTVAQVKAAFTVLECHPDLTAELRAAGQLRLAHPELSLSQLAALADPPISKDTLTGRLRRLLARAATHLPTRDRPGDRCPGATTSPQCYRRGDPPARWGRPRRSRETIVGNPTVSITAATTCRRMDPGGARQFGSVSVASPSASRPSAAASPARAVSGMPAGSRPPSSSCSAAVRR